MDGVIARSGDDFNFVAAADNKRGAIVESLATILDLCKVAAGVIPSQFEYKSLGKHKTSSVTTRQPYRMQEHFHGWKDVQDDPKVKAAPPLAWNIHLCCNNLKDPENPCYSYLHIGAPDPDANFMLGPDGGVYVPIYMQFYKCSDRHLRAGSKGEFTPCGPLVPVHALSMCLEHTPGFKAGKMRAKEREKHVANLRNTSTGPASFANEATAALSPDKFGRSGVSGFLTKSQARSIQYASTGAGLGKKSGTDFDVVTDYVGNCGASEKQVDEIFPLPSPDGPVPKVKNRLWGKVHEVICHGSRKGFIFLTMAMLLATATAVHQGGGGCHLDFTGNIMPTVFGITMYGLVIASPFPNLVTKGEINPAIGFIALTNRQTHYDIVRALEFYSRMWLETFQVPLPFKYYQSDCALEILCAVMHVVNKCRPMAYNMMVEYLLWNRLPLTQVLRITGKPLFWDTYHSTGAVRKWVMKQQWPVDNADFMRRWVVAIFRAIRDCTSLRYAYSIIVLFITLLGSKKLPWQGQIHKLPMHGAIPLRIRGRLDPSKTPEFKEISIPLSALDSESINTLTTPHLVQDMLSIDTTVAAAEANLDVVIAATGAAEDAGAAAEDAGAVAEDAVAAAEDAGAAAEDAGATKDAKDPLFFVDGVDTDSANQAMLREDELAAWLAEGEDLPQAEARLNKRMQQTAAGSGYEVQVQCGEHKASFVVNTGNFTSDYKAWHQAESAASYKSADGVLYDPILLVGRKLEDQSGCPDGLEAWYLTVKPFGIGRKCYLDPSAEEIDNPFWQGDDINVISYLCEQWFSYLPQVTSMLRCPSAGIPVKNKAAASVEKANDRIKAVGNFGKKRLGLWSTLNRWGGLVGCSARDTANSFAKACNDCIQGLNKVKNASILRGWLDVEALAVIHRANVAYSATTANAVGVVGAAATNGDGALGGDEPGYLVEGQWDRHGLDSGDRDNFCIPLRDMLHSLEQTLGSVGAWKYQLSNEGHFRHFWLSLFPGPRLFTGLVGTGRVRDWSQIGSQMESPVPRPDNGGALEYFALKAFMEMAELEIAVLRLPSQQGIPLCVDRCRARMGALMHAAAVTADAFAYLDVNLNLPAMEPLVASAIPIPALDTELESAAGFDEMFFTQDGELGGGGEQQQVQVVTGITPDVQQMVLEAPPNSNSPNKRVHEDDAARAGRGTKRGGRGRGRGRGGRVAK